MIDLVILGIGNTDIIKLIESINNVEPKYQIHGFLDSNKANYGKSLLGYPILGGDEMLKDQFTNISIVINLVVKNRLEHKQFIEANYGTHNYPNIVHPSVNLDHVSLGFGNVIYDNVGLASQVSLGDFNVVYPGTMISHEVSLGSNNLVALNVSIGGRCRIGNSNLIGNSSVVSHEVIMGNNNVIGIGSAVYNNIESFNHLLGNPAINAKEFFRKNLAK
jgi:UDP-3-O-[3-hydroxymyristoyl] glucosamine N-acyltransferase